MYFLVIWMLLFAEIWMIPKSFPKCPSTIIWPAVTFYEISTYHREIISTVKPRDWWKTSCCSHEILYKSYSIHIMAWSSFHSTFKHTIWFATAPWRWVSQINISGNGDTESLQDFPGHTVRSQFWFLKGFGSGMSFERSPSSSTTTILPHWLQELVLQAIRTPLIRLQQPKGNVQTGGAEGSSNQIGTPPSHWLPGKQAIS